MEVPQAYGITGVPVYPQVSLVCDLLTPSGGWNDDLIKQLFADIDAHAILRTPIRGAEQEA
jgi:hypothetical protein